jgi:uncharacterized protein
MGACPKAIAIAFVVFAIGQSASANEALRVAQTEPNQRAAPRAQAAESFAWNEDKEKANANTVSIIASGAASTYTKLAEDIFNVLDDPNGNEIRILPVIGRGGQHNVFDILNLRGIDMGFTDSSILDYYRKLDPKKYAGIEKRVQYIAKIANSEVHIVARNQFSSVTDLRNQKVNFYQKGSTSALIAADIFDTMDIPVSPVYLNQDDANKALRNGEIAASVRMSSIGTNIKKSDGLHPLPVDSSVPNFDKLRLKYLPGQIKKDHYPDLLQDDASIPTIANSIVLAVYAWPENTERYRRIANFVNRFFNNIDKLMLEPRDPKWRSINLAAQVPGWIRFKAAQEWIDANATKLSTIGSVRPAFEKFVQEYSKVQGSQPMSPEQSQALVSEFLDWWEKKRSSRNP